MLIGSKLIILVFTFLSLLLLEVDLMPLIDKFLLALDVLEHVLGLGHAHVIGEHFRVVLVELEDAG